MDHGNMRQIRQLIEKHGSQLEGQALDDFLSRATELFDDAAKAAAPVLAPEVKVEAAPAQIINQQSVQPLLRYFYGKVLSYCAKPDAFTEEAKTELTRLTYLINLSKQLIQQEGATAP